MSEERIGEALGVGIVHIARERMEQFEKHKFSIASDKIKNKAGQLSQAAFRLLSNDVLTAPAPTNMPHELWKRMQQKSYKERLIIAGALIAAELDRIADNADTPKEKIEPVSEDL